VVHIDWRIGEGMFDCLGFIFKSRFPTRIMRNNKGDHSRFLDWPFLIGNGRFVRDVKVRVSLDFACAANIGKARCDPSIEIAVGGLTGPLTQRSICHRGNSSMFDLFPKGVFARVLVAQGI
jgi:hypothetical protein